MALDVDRIGAVDDNRFGAGDHAPALRRPADASLSTYLAWAVILVAMTIFNELAIAELQDGRAVVAGRENGPLEYAQLLAMIPALALFAAAWCKSRGTVGVAAAFLALMGAMALVREVDLKSLNGAHEWVRSLWSHGVQDGLLAGLALAGVVYFFHKRRYFWSLVRLGARWQAWPCAFSLLLLATAELYLDGFTGPTGHFWEELVETNGYFLFAIAAWRHSSLVGDRALDQPL